LNGLTLSQAKRLITDRLATVYSGIRARRPSTYVDVTLGKLRTIQVFILGDVVRPGGYTISSVSTVLNALYNAGGPTARGSMRDIRIIRHNEVYRHVDLYGYILTGSKADDVRLQTGDVVFVPPVGKSVAVLGEVHRPAIVELAPGERFHELMRLSGGVLTTAVLTRALVDRIVPFDERDSLRHVDRIAIDFPLGEILADSARNPDMMDRDIVQVFRVGNLRRNTVTLSGSAVWRPGVFQWRAGMKVSDLVADAGGLKPEAYLERATIVRTAADSTRSVVPFDLGLALRQDPANDLALEELDEVSVRSIWDLTGRYSVTVHGSVKNPGTYEYLDDMTAMDLIFRAGGFQVSADRREIEVSRVDSTTIVTGKSAQIFRVPISGEYSVDSSAAGFRLQRWDQVFVREIPDWRLQRNVTVTGEVVYPGVYSLNSDTERLSSVMKRTGGLKPTAYPQGATFVRRKGGAGRLAVDVASVAKGKRRYDLILDDGDSLHVPKEPRTVKVVGEVGFPASVLYEKGKSLGFYIEQAGGYTEMSDKGRVKVVQPSGKVEAVKRHWFDPEPKAGALVVVPPKPPALQKDTLKDVATIVTIIAGAVTSIFVIVEASN
jgi:protein involved in polysaccharide export with SLBB domain